MLNKNIKSTWSVTYLTFVAMMTALCVVGRFLTTPLPNVQPVTAILIFLASYFGLRTSLLVGLLSIGISNLYLGFGPWTLAQLLAYALVIVLAFTVSQIHFFRQHLWAMALFAGLAGYLYGFSITALTAPFYQIKAFWPYYFQGLLFDTYHAAGNVIFYLILTPVVLRVLTHFPRINRWQLKH